MRLYKAIFGAAYVAFGALVLWRVGSAPSPAGAKLMGLAFGAALAGLGIVRIRAYLIARQAGRA